MAREVRAGETIVLRARFRDDFGENVEASTVLVSIFDPTVTEFIPENATVVDAVTTYFGEGIYEYSYIVPDCGPEGVWRDLWGGTLTCQSVSDAFSFTVSANGSVTQLESQLYVNNVVKIEVRDIYGTDGTLLSEPFILEFLTTTSPAYTNIRKVHLEGGAWISTVLDDTIQTAILEASVEADIITSAVRDKSSSLYLHARREYVTCLVNADLLGNMSANNIKYKSLDNLSVAYDTDMIKDALARAEDCVDRWLPQLEYNQVYAKGVVKGEYDPDRHQVSRMWVFNSKDVAGRGMPAANDRVKFFGSRRYRRRFAPK